MKNVPNVGNVWVALGWMVGSYVIEKVIDYIFEEIKEAK